MQTRFSIISNSIFKYFLIFSISFLWLNYYNRDILLVSLISIIITIIISYIVNKIAKKRKDKISLTIKDNEKMKTTAFQLLMADNNDILTFFTILLKIKNNPKIIKSKQLIEFSNKAFIPFYRKKQLSEDDLIEVFKTYNYDHIIISCIEYSDEALQLSKKIASKKISIINHEQLFVLLKKYDLFPDFNIAINPKKRFKFVNIKDIAFMKKNSRHYLFSGVIILISSLFIKYNIYYLIFATLLFVLSGISFFKSQPNQQCIIDEI